MAVACTSQTCSSLYFSARPESGPKLICCGTAAYTGSVITALSQPTTAYAWEQPACVYLCVYVWTVRSGLVQQSLQHTCMLSKCTGACIAVTSCWQQMHRRLYCCDHLLLM